MCAAIVLITGACSLLEQNNEEKFVNPLFYKKLISVSYGNDYIKLTPTSIYIKESDDFQRNYACKLIENKKDTVSLYCLLFDEYRQKYIPGGLYTYTIKPCNQDPHCLDKGAWMVYQKVEPDMYKSNSITYVIPSEPDDVPNDRFVNPLFYKRLSPISRTARTTFLTPTSHKWIDISNQEHIEQCRMIANTPIFVTLECYYYDEFLKQMTGNTCRYSLRYCDEKKESYCHGGDWIILRKCSGSDEWLVIHKEDMGQQ